MLKEEFEKLMLEEWRDKVLLRVDCEDEWFDKLYAIKDRLYDFFYPLNINTIAGDTHYVSEVFSEVKYALDDDGELSVVVAYTDMCDKDRQQQIEIMRKIRPDYEPKPRTEEDLRVDVFVVNGYDWDLSEEYIKEIALRHSGDSRKFVKFVAKNFTYEVLDFICGLKNRFDAAKQLSIEESNSDLVGFDKLMHSSKHGYFAFVKETDKILVDFVLSLES